MRTFARELIRSPVRLRSRRSQSRWRDGCMSATSIASVRARRVFDSRGRPTLEAEVSLAGGASGRAIAPAGASRGTHEAVDLRDGGERFGGLDVANAIANVDGPIRSALVKSDALDQSAVDATLIALDGTPNKAKLGGNATVAVSLAVAHAAAAAQRVPLWKHFAKGQPVSLPLPEVQYLRRRRSRRPQARRAGPDGHASRRLDVCGRARAGRRGLSRRRRLLAERGELAGVADEGGYWPRFSTNVAALDLLMRAIERAGLHPGTDMAISLDVAASELGRDGRYVLALERRTLDRDELPRC